ncbi:MAG: DUF6338 family protein [Vicinamibacterales bacterium]
MPTTVAAALVLVFAMFPGFVGNRVYEYFVGLDWREREWRTVLRLIGFSVTGAMLYALSAAAAGVQPPVHLFPATFQELTPDSPLLQALATGYIGHLLASAVAGGLAVGSASLLAKLSSASPYASAWDDFARSYTPKHWVVVGLTNGEVYAGKLKNSDVAVAMEDRDLVLEEPCLYNPDKAQYVAVSYQYLFVPAATWFSIAVVADPKDKRTVAVGEPLFTREDSQ